jgi:hypothetical protein
MSTSSTEIDRLALRIGALRSARRRRSIRDGAWAAERLRLDGIVLDRSDARFAHEAVVRFGHALRVARVRRPWAGHADDEVVPGLSPRSWTWRIAAALLLAVVAAAVFFIARPQSGSDDSAAGPVVTSGGGGAPAASPLRGRSNAAVRVPIVATSPLPGSSGAPLDVEEPLRQPGGGGSGSTGASSAGPVRTAAPTPAPNVMRLTGRVVDSKTGNALPGVCVSIGATTCAQAPITDAIGFWTVDLNLGQVLSWNLKFVKSDYVQQEINVPSRPGTFTVDTISLLSFH